MLATAICMLWLKNFSRLLAVSSSDTTSSPVQNFRSKYANFVTEPCFSTLLL